MLTALSNTDGNGVGWKLALNANLNEQQLTIQSLRHKQIS